MPAPSCWLICQISLLPLLSAVSMSHLLIYTTLLAFCKCQVYSTSERQIKNVMKLKMIFFFPSESQSPGALRQPVKRLLKVFIYSRSFGFLTEIGPFCKVFLLFHRYLSFSPSSLLFNLFILPVCSQLVFISYVEGRIQHTVGMDIKTVFGFQILPCDLFELESYDEAAVVWSAATHQIRANLLVVPLALMKRHIWISLELLFPFQLHNFLFGFIWAEHSPLVLLLTSGGDQSLCWRRLGLGSDHFSDHCSEQMSEEECVLLCDYCTEDRQI